MPYCPAAARVLGEMTCLTLSLHCLCPARWEQWMNGGGSLTTVHPLPSSVLPYHTPVGENHLSNSQPPLSPAR